MTLAATELDTDLNRARRIHAGATRRAARAWALLNELARAQVWLEAAPSRAYLTETRYYAAGRDEPLEEFAESVAEMTGSSMDTQVIGSTDTYRLRPYFADDCGLVLDLGLGNQSPARLAEFQALDVEPLDEPRATEPSGLSAAELDVVARDYRRRTLTLVNAMRRLQVALGYLVRCPVRTSVAAPRIVQADDIRSVLDALVAAVSLEFEPPVPAHFGSEADKRITLRKLEHEEGIAQLLAS